MKLMRNVRTGKVVVYDESLLATGNYESVDPVALATEQTAEAKPKKKGNGLIDPEILSATDQVQIELVRGEDTHVV